MPNLDHPLVKRVREALKKANCFSLIVDLDTSARSASDAALSMGVPLGSIVKTLLFSIGLSPVIVLVAGDRVCLTEYLNKAFKLEGKVKKPVAKSVYSFTGFSIGGGGAFGA